MKLIRALPDTCTTQEVITICEDLQKEGHRVVIEHLDGRILLYDESVNEGEMMMPGLAALKRLFSGLAKDAPPADSPHRGEYEETMRQLEKELRDKGAVF